MTNPLLENWDATGGLPPFAIIQAADFLPAFRAAMSAHRQEMEAIATDPVPATFDNTFLLLETAGRQLDRVGSIFGLLTGACTTPELQAIDEEISPELSRHHSAIAQNEALFRRVNAVFQNRAVLAPEARRLVEETHRQFIRAGAALAPAEKERLTDLTAEISSLQTEFGKRLLAEAEAPALIVTKADDLAGLPAEAVTAAAAEAAQRGLPGQYVLTLARSNVEKFLTFATRRDLRERVFHAFASRNDNGNAQDTKPLINEILPKRAARAALLGYPDYAAYALDGAMVKTPRRARQLLDDIWTPAAEKFKAERTELQEVARLDGQNELVAPWDWRFYAEKVRQQKYALDDAEVKPYLALDHIVAAAFSTATRLFGLQFQEIAGGHALHHLDARLWQVTDRNGHDVALFIGDYFARKGKHDGAWMSELRGQHKLNGGQRPIIYNVCNFTRPPEGEPALISLSDAQTVFHEFGHALHGMLSDVTYPSLAGTNVTRDYVELPSQIYEKWLLTPEVLQGYCRHVETGAPMPDATYQKIKASHTFCQGYETLEYLASALVDLELHTRTDYAGFDINRFEADTLAAHHLPEGAVMRHRSPHFSHIFEGGYASAYYSYLWAAMLDTDAFAAFTEAGEVFDPVLGERLHREIYASGNTRDALESYQAFRGRGPRIDALLAERGFTNPASSAT